MNWIVAIGVMMVAIGVVLVFLGIPSHARYGYSTLIEIGGLMVLIPVGIAFLAGAGWVAFLLITQQPFVVSK